MKMTAEDLKRMGMIEEIIPERMPAGAETVPEISACLKQKIKEYLKRQNQKTPEKIAEERYERFRRM